MKVLVCGSRDYSDKNTIRKAIEKCLPVELLVEGGAWGADTLAYQVAKELGIPVQTHHAIWKRYGKAAGPIRNQEMLDAHPDLDLVLAFPLAQSRGTFDMIRRAKEAGVKVHVEENQG